VIIGAFELPVVYVGYLVEGTGTLDSSFFGASEDGIPRELGLYEVGIYGYY
jgi:hypothetical protein